MFIRLLACLVQPFELLCLKSNPTQPSTSMSRYDFLAMYLAQHRTLTSAQPNLASVVISVNMPSGSGMPVSTLSNRTPASSFLQYRMPSTSNQVSSNCYMAGLICQILSASAFAPSHNYTLLSDMTFRNQGVAPNVVVSGSQRIGIIQFICCLFNHSSNATITCSVS